MQSQSITKGSIPIGIKMSSKYRKKTHFQTNWHANFEISLQASWILQTTSMRPGNLATAPIGRSWTACLGNRIQHSKFRYSQKLWYEDLVFWQGWDSWFWGAYLVGPDLKNVQIEHPSHLPSIDRLSKAAAAVSIRSALLGCVDMALTTSGNPLSSVTILALASKKIINKFSLICNIAMDG